MSKQPRTKGNLQPSSSRRAADVLASQGISNLSIRNPFTMFEERVDTLLCPELELLVKKLEKKDSKTKRSALEQILRLAAPDLDWEPFLPIFVELYCSLCEDPDTIVRNYSNSVLTKLSENFGNELRELAKKYLASLVGSCYDFDSSVSLSAKKAFSSIFPAKFQNLIPLYKNELLKYIAGVEGQKNDFAEMKKSVSAIGIFKFLSKLKIDFDSSILDRERFIISQLHSPEPFCRRGIYGFISDFRNSLSEGLLAAALDQVLEESNSLTFVEQWKLLDQLLVGMILREEFGKKLKYLILREIKIGNSPCHIYLNDLLDCVSERKKFIEDLYPSRKIGFDAAISSFRTIMACLRGSNMVTFVYNVLSFSEREDFPLESIFFPSQFEISEPFFTDLLTLHESRPFSSKNFFRFCKMFESQRTLNIKYNVIEKDFYIEGGLLLLGDTPPRKQFIEDSINALPLHMNEIVEVILSNINSFDMEEWYYLISNVSPKHALDFIHRIVPNHEKFQTLGLVTFLEQNYNEDETKVSDLFSIALGNRTLAEMACQALCGKSNVGFLTINKLKTFEYCFDIFIHLFSVDPFQITCLNEVLSNADSHQFTIFCDLVYKIDSFDKSSKVISHIFLSCRKIFDRMVCEFDFPSKLKNCCFFHPALPVRDKIHISFAQNYDREVEFSNEITQLLFSVASILQNIYPEDCELVSCFCLISILVKDLEFVGLCSHVVSNIFNAFISNTDLSKLDFSRWNSIYKDIILPADIDTSKFSSDQRLHLSLNTRKVSIEDLKTCFSCYHIGVNFSALEYVQREGLEDIFAAELLSLSQTILKLRNSPFKSLFCQMLSKSFDKVSALILSLESRFTSIHSLIHSDNVDLILAARNLLFSNRMTLIQKYENSFSSLAASEREYRGTGIRFDQVFGFSELLDIFCLDPVHILELDSTDLRVLNYFISWEIFFFLANSDKLPVRNFYREQLEENNYLVLFYETIFAFLETMDSNLDLSKYDLSEFSFDDYDHSPKLLRIFLGHLVYNSVEMFPSLLRKWWNSCKSKALCAFTLDFIERNISPSIIQDQISFIIQDMKIKALRTTTLNSLVAMYSIEDVQMELKIQIPNCFPLEQVVIQSDKRLGVGEAQWRKWLLSAQMTIQAQNSIREGLVLWKKNADKRFEGVKDCAICYSVFQPTDQTLPSHPCHTCKNKFHAACLYKWFNTSGQSTCPLCRSIF